MQAAAAPADSSVKLGVTDEWKEARTVVDNADSQLSSLRQYGFTIVSSLLAAQGLIEFPLATSSQTVPDPVKFAILIATDFLVLGLFDLDLRTRTIQRAAAHRACMLEGKDGLTRLVSRAYKPHPHTTSVDVLYLTFILATTILGVAVLAPSPFTVTTTFVVLVVGLLIVTTSSVAIVYRYSRHVKGGWHHPESPPE
jgi:hypothetical protein